MATAIQRSALLNRQSFLIDQNVTWLRQAILLLDRMDDRTYLESPPSLAPHRVGGHLRHILEFYECFLDGLETNDAMLRGRPVAFALTAPGSSRGGCRPGTAVSQSVE